MSIRIKTFLLLSLILLGSIIIYIWVYSRIDYQRLIQELKNQATQAEYTFRVEKSSTEKRMLQLATTITSEEKYQQLFLLGKHAVDMEGGGGGGALAAQVRNTLFEHIQKNHNGLVQRLGFQQLQFHLAPGALSFLRMNHPEKFGDQLDDVRFMVVAANKNHKKIAGFETGRVVSALRGIVPMDAFDGSTKKKVHVGAVEVGTSFKGMVENIHHHLPWLNIAVLLSREHLQAKMWPDALAKLIKKHSIIHNFYIDASSSPQINSFLQKAELVKLFQQSGSYIFQAEEASYNLRSFPLRDYQGEGDPSIPDAGRIIIWQDISESINAYYDRVARLIFYGVLLFLNLEAIMFVAINLMTRQLRKELEQVQNLEEESEKARLVAEESSRSKTEFLGTISHELRTPLNAIIGMGQILTESSLSNQQQEQLNKLNLSSHKLLTIIDEILLLSKLDQQQVESFPTVTFNPCQLVQMAIDGFVEQTSQQGIELTFDCGAGIPQHVTGHATQLEQVLRQLIGNAIKFSDGHDVGISLAVVAHDAGTVRLEFAIIDHGIGISTTQQVEIFKPFYQGDSSKTRSYNGTGLGLTIADKVTHQLGEKIKVTSTLGEGSCFSFQLTFTLDSSTTAVIDTDVPAVTGDQIAVVAPEIVIDIALISELLEQLDGPLAAMQPLPCQEIAKQLKGKQCPGLWCDDIAKLVSLIEQYRFAEASQVAAKLKESIAQEKSEPQ